MPKVNNKFPNANLENITERTAELCALFLAVDVICQSKLKKFVFFSDSLSSLQAIDGFNIDNDLVQKFIKEYSVFMLHSKSCWYSWK